MAQRGLGQAGEGLAHLPESSSFYSQRVGWSSSAGSGGRAVGLLSTMLIRMSEQSWAGSPQRSPGSLPPSCSPLRSSVWSASSDTLMPAFGCPRPACCDGHTSHMVHPAPLPAPGVWCESSRWEHRLCLASCAVHSKRLVPWVVLARI